MSGRSYQLRHRRALATGNAPADDVFAPLVFQSAGVFVFADSGSAALEFVDVSGTAARFDLLPVGTTPSAARLRARARGVNRYVALR